MKNLAFFLFCCVAACGNASAQLYKTVNSAGQVSYSDRPAEGGSVKVIASTNPTARSAPVEQPAADTSGKLVRVNMEFTAEAAKALVGGAGVQPVSNRKLGFQAVAR